MLLVSVLLTNAHHAYCYIQVCCSNMGAIPSTSRATGMALLYPRVPFLLYELTVVEVHLDIWFIACDPSGFDDCAYPDLLPSTK